ncbi:hypothetical protein [Paramagnetospirillum magnetotacticum]|nr:hypothetical protein [Paramagnetospirillum magnetotacticum]
MADLKIAIYEAGAISDREIQWMKDCLDRYGINDVTARFLLDINNLLSGTVPEAFAELFRSTLSTFVLGNDRIISDEMWTWLKENLLKDDIIDGLERQLLDELRQAAAKMPAEMTTFAV